MAKKSKYDRIALKCTVCNTKNYFTTKNPTNIKDKLSFNKYCRVCKKHTEHVEAKAK